MKLWSKRIDEREVFEVLSCERVPLIEGLNEIVAFSIEYNNNGVYKNKSFGDVFRYYENDILNITDLIEGCARIKLGIDTNNHAKDWLLEVVNWFSGNKRDLKDEDIKLGNTLRDWNNLGVSLIIPKEVKPKFDEFYSMAKKFNWNVEIRDNVMFKTTLNYNDVYVLMLKGDVVNERLDNILSGGGVFTLEKRVVCDDEWFSGWLVKDIDINKKYSEICENVEFEEPKDYGFLGEECLNNWNEYENLKNKEKFGNELIKLVKEILGKNKVGLKCNISELLEETESLFSYVRILSENFWNLYNNIKSGNIHEVNKILDNLEFNTYEILDKLDSIKEDYKILFKNLIDILKGNENLSTDEIKNLIDICLKINKNLYMLYNLLGAISEWIIKFENIPDIVVRRLNIINAFIEKVCKVILNIRENEGKTLSHILSMLQNHENEEILMNRVKEIVDSLYFSYYDSLMTCLGEFEFKFLRDLVSMSVLYDYPVELKKDELDEIFNHTIFKLLKNNGFNVEEFDILESLLNIRKKLSLFSNKEVRYFDKELFKIIRGFVECTKKEDYDDNVIRLKEFIENLEDINQILEKCRKLREYKDGDFYDLDDIF